MEKLQRRKWLIFGIVQGVGFRPHVARTAADFPVTGFVGNSEQHVFIEAQGAGSALDAFIAAVRARAPQISRIAQISSQEMAPVAGERDFRIVLSTHTAGARTLIPPDIATCPECLAEIRDPHNRRSGYAFTTCTNCGPRLSIIEDLPYDRPFTTMRDFPMCPQCAVEYRDPHNRRYHAQPISCYQCGPHLWFISGEQDVPAALRRPGGADPFSDDAAGAAVPAELIDGSRGGRDKAAQDAAIVQAVAALQAGQIVAVKGIGGFHLLVDATNAQAVARLRARKRRDGKPFAVMVPDLAQARQIVDLGAPGSAAERALLGIERPIVIAKRRRSVESGANEPVRSEAAEQGAAGASERVPAGVTGEQVPAGVTGEQVPAGVTGESSLVCDAVAPGLSTLGVMIAYSPLHTLLLARFGRPVVATSGNLSSEPLCYTNAQAISRLGTVADAFLLHNRDIAVPVEDSVVLAGSDTGAIGSGAGSSITSSASRPAAGLTSSSAGRIVVPVRRSRGFAPVPVQLGAGYFSPEQRQAAGAKTSEPPVVLGVGGELKNAFALARDDMAFVSAHIGDMGSLAAQQAYEAAISQMLQMHRRVPAVIVHDAHPNYATTAWAERYAAQRTAAGAPITRLALQHHRAHALSLLAERADRAGTAARRAVIAALDGTGYGDDGAIWGSEIFGVDGAALTAGKAQQSALPRLWHLPYFPLVGGDLAVKEPWRLALALSYEYGIARDGLGAAGNGLARRAQTPAGKATWLQLRAGGGVPVDSVGRYFDAVAALLGLCEEAHYEADAAVRLQEAAERFLARHDRRAAMPAGPRANPRPADLSRHDELPSAGAAAAPASAGQPVFSSAPELVTGVVAAYRQALTSGQTRPHAQEYGAWLFHKGIGELIARELIRQAAEFGTRVLGVTGGSAANTLLVSIIRARVEAAGYSLLTHTIVPSNDGGLALGQAYYGYLRARA